MNYQYCLYSLKVDWMDGPIMLMADKRRLTSLRESQNLYYLNSHMQRLLAKVGWCKYFVATDTTNLKAELSIKYCVDLTTRCSRCDCCGGCRSAGIVAEIQSTINGHGDGQQKSMNLGHQEK
jgi:hypothetical protein